MILVTEDYPLISVIVPIYRVEKYLNQCVKSIVDQSYTKLEIILIDDGSNDNSSGICDNWAMKDDRIKVIHKKNGGLSDARNAGLGIATGEYISFIDSDDWVDTNFISSLYAAIKKYDAQIAECSVAFVDEKGLFLHDRNAEAESEIIDKRTALKHLIEERGICQTVWNKLYKRTVIGKLLFEKGKYHEDEFWTYKVFDKIEHLAIVSESLYYYRQRNSSIMGSGYSLKRLDGLQAKYERAEYLKKYPELSDLCRTKLINDCMWHFQAAIRVLQGDELENAMEYILKIVKSISKEGINYQFVPIKNRIWLELFLKKP